MIACDSVAGFSWGSQMTTTDADRMLSPTPPAVIWRDEHGAVSRLPIAEVAGRRAGRWRGG